MAGRGDNTRAKPGIGPDVEPLRRAITGCVRSVAGSADVEVVFANERPGLAGERVRLPELSKKPSAHELAVTRGLGDSMALRLACHDQRIHSTMAPQGTDARLVFDAVEQARVESIGALRMSGMGDNISAMNAEKYAKANFSGINRQEDAPIQEAVAMLVREKLTGEKPPESAGKVLDLWRPFIEQKAGADLDNL
ncbi:MAG: cobaltochelatase subunit CobT, partial [Rhizobium sp.]|nr:cobaltochelatase subunit CobT [Rhizobium sp.]